VATYNKFENFIEEVFEKKHDCSADQLEVYLSNATPSASLDSVKADLAEIATGNGYTAPVDTQNTGARSGLTYTLTGTKVVITASGGAIAQFRYVVLFNTTHASDGLVAWWDYGSAVDLLDGETFSIKFNNSDTTGTIFTAA
jgi:hypothetical protein